MLALGGCKWGGGKWERSGSDGVYLCAKTAQPNAPRCGGNLIYLCNGSGSARNVKVYGNKIGAGDIWPSGLAMTAPADSDLTNGKAPLIGYDKYTTDVGNACNFINYSFVVQ